MLEVSGADLQKLRLPLLHAEVTLPGSDRKGHEFALRLSLPRGLSLRCVLPCRACPSRGPTRQPAWNGSPHLATGKLERPLAGARARNAGTLGRCWGTWQWIDKSS